MNIEVGEYIRTKNGVITQLEYIHDKDEVYWFDKVIYSRYGEEIDFLTTEELPDNEAIISVLDTFVAEVSRLEDLEDRKIEAEIGIIEEKRDKYWKNKIIEKIIELADVGDLIKDDKKCPKYKKEAIIEEISDLKEILEENKNDTKRI